MIDQLDLISRQLGISSEILMISGISLGALMTFFGIASFLMKKNVAVERMAAITIDSRRANRQNKAILKAPSKDPGAFMKSFIPGDRGRAFGPAAQTGARRIDRGRQPCAISPWSVCSWA